MRKFNAGCAGHGQDSSGKAARPAGQRCWVFIINLANDRITSCEDFLPRKTRLVAYEGEGGPELAYRFERFAK